MIPNDPRFPEQWSLSNPEVSGGVPAADIHAPAAWAATTGSSETIIAVMDHVTGVRQRQGTDERAEDSPALTGYGNPTRLCTGCSENGMPEDCSQMMANWEDHHHWLLKKGDEGLIAGRPALEMPGELSPTGHVATQPQDSGHGRSAELIKCANDAGLGYLLTDSACNSGHRFNDQNAMYINRVALIMGVDSGLLGFTFDHEGRFDQQAGPNMNGQDDPHNGDWGPFQLNYNQTFKDIYAGSYSLEGLDIHAVFGDLGLFGASSTALSPVQNGILAGRKLQYVLNKSKGDYAVAAGRYRSWKGSDFTTRRDEWKKEGGLFQRFFRCFTQSSSD